MFASQYEEHVAHSTTDGSQWDGFDRGDIDEPQASRVILGRMTTEAGSRVVVVEDSRGDEVFHTVTVGGECVFSEPDSRERALAVGRWWLDGCPA